MTTPAEDLSLDDARAEADDLVARIDSAREAYYGADTSPVDDATYDGWMHRLEQLEAAHPILRAQDSPTQTVGAAETTGLETIAHAERMLSLDNVFSPDELRDWCVRAQQASGRDVRWLTELKIDGLAINLRYERGVLTSAATRGDGRVGEVVTENALRVAGIPERLAGESHPEIVEVRGEVFIPVEQFHELNALQASLRERAFAEARERWERVRSAGKKPFDEQRQRQAA
ncbi:MAG TPA: NAD-dependent DNA ligase LigA, partial [Microbacterium sp.]|nr:NAD-dependent DNA ligase LigA [Microbacterium sp.]